MLPPTLPMPPPTEPVSEIWVEWEMRGTACAEARDAVVGRPMVWPANRELEAEEAAAQVYSPEPQRPCSASGAKGTAVGGVIVGSFSKAARSRAGSTSEGRLSLIFSSVRSSCLIGWV